MARLGRYSAIALLVGASGAVMVWAAAPPDDRLTQFIATTTGTAISHTAEWFRNGPADGNPDWDMAAASVYDGDATRGAHLIKTYGCVSCHTVPGISGATGSVGPSLRGFADRAYVAGVLPNEPGGLVRWLVDPTIHAPQTAMPDLGVSEHEARDMASYLYTLRGR